LLQDGRPLAYVSKPLGIKTQGLSTCEKEYLAILIAVEQWRCYLQLAEFIIFTDQKALIHLNDQRLHTVWQQRVFAKLLGLRYRIVYKKGTDNSAADSLFRRLHPTDECAAISVVTPQWYADIAKGHYYIVIKKGPLLRSDLSRAVRKAHHKRFSVLAISGRW
jgi:hypothetical protein